jgi:anti-sigma factor RsiW
MNCKKVRLRLSAYQDGELSSPLSRAVELHMASCAACQSEWAALQALIHSLRRSTPFAEDPGFSSRIMAGLRTRPATKLRLLPSLAYSLALVMIFISGFLLAMSANGLPTASPPTAMTFSAVLAESRTLGLLAVQDSTLEMLSKLKQISLVKKQDNLLSKLPILPSRVSGDAHEN